MGKDNIIQVVTAHFLFQPLDFKIRDKRIPVYPLLMVPFEIRIYYTFHLYVTGIEDDKLDVFTGKGFIQGVYSPKIHPFPRSMFLPIVVPRCKITWYSCLTD